MNNKHKTKYIAFVDLPDDIAEDVVNCIGAYRGAKYTEQLDAITKELRNSYFPLFNVDPKYILPPIYDFDEERVKEYEDLMNQGIEFPPVVILDGELCEGVHRSVAAMRAGRTIRAVDIVDYIEPRKATS
jgi:hypothetical protein